MDGWIYNLYRKRHVDLPHVTDWLKTLSGMILHSLKDPFVVVHHLGYIYIYIIYIYKCCWCHIKSDLVIFSEPNSIKRSFWSYHLTSSCGSSPIFCNSFSYPSLDKPMISDRSRWYPQPHKYTWKNQTAKKNASEGLRRLQLIWGIFCFLRHFLFSEAFLL